VTTQSRGRAPEADDATGVTRATDPPEFPRPVERTLVVQLAYSKHCLQPPSFRGARRREVGSDDRASYTQPHLSRASQVWPGACWNRTPLSFAAVRQSRADTTRRDHRQTHVRPRPRHRRSAPVRSARGPATPGPTRLASPTGRFSSASDCLPIVFRIALSAVFVALGPLGSCNRDRVLAQGRPVGSARRSVVFVSDVTSPPSPRGLQPRPTGPRPSSSRPSRTRASLRRPVLTSNLRRRDACLPDQVYLPCPPESHADRGRGPRRRTEDGHPRRADQGLTTSRSRSSVPAASRKPSVSVPLRIRCRATEADVTAPRKCLGQRQGGVRSRARRRRVTTLLARQRWPTVRRSRPRGRGRGRSA